MVSPGQDTTSTHDETEGDTPNTVSVRVLGVSMLFYVGVVEGVALLYACDYISTHLQDERLLMILSNLSFVMLEIIPRLFQCFNGHGYPPAADIYEVRPSH